MNSAISALVLNEGGCLRCALRLAGEISMATYQTTPDTKCACPFCLGILYPTQYTQQTIDSIQSFNSEFTDYKFQVTLPPVIYLRHEWLLGKFKVSGLSLDRVVDIKDVLKWVFSPIIGQILNKPFNINSEFRLNFTFECPDSQSEIEDFFKEFGGKKKESMLTVFKGVNSERIMNKFPVLKAYDVGLKVECNLAPVYVTGNYLKLSRKVSQSPWSVEGDTEVLDSVQDCMGRVICKEFSASGCVLHASGREDIDVRMLGTGRPFILEIQDAKNSISAFSEFSSLEQKINSSSPHIKVLKLQKAGKEKFEEIRLGEEGKLKVYACIIWLEKKLNNEDLNKIDSIKELVIKQKTPIRVMHRRSLMIREKNILRSKCRWINEHYLELRIITSGGTYVKEFVHGDFGRTVPSIAEILGCKADILQLDVLGLGWNVEEVEELLVKDIE